MRSSWLLPGVFAIVGLCACSAPTADGDGGDANDVGIASDVIDVSDGSAPFDATDAVDVPTAHDVMLTDVAAHDAQPFACGTSTCTANQICVAHSGGAIIEPQCMDIPAACGGVATCGCVCAVGPMFTCSSTDGQTFMCACTTCP